VLVLVIVLVIEDIENTAMYQHKKSIEKRERLFDGACVVFLVDYDYDYEHEHETAPLRVHSDGTVAPAASSGATESTSETPALIFMLRLSASWGFCS